MATHVLHEAENGRTVTVRIGDQVCVELDEIPGYKWSEPEFDPEHLSLVKSEQIPPHGPGIGAGPVRRFIFDVTRGGTSDVRSSYQRPWELNAEPAMRFRITVAAS